MRRALRLGIYAVVVLVLTAGVAQAATLWNTTGGVADFTPHSLVKSAATAGAPTSYKPESKLFYTQDNRWWAILGDSTGTHSLFELVDHRWQLELTLPGADPWMRADALLDGNSLYITLRDNKASVTGNPRESLLYRLSYDGAGGWTVVGEPSRVTTSNPETLTIARDTLGRLWTTFEKGGSILVGYTGPGGSSFTFKTIATGATSDDISAVTSFGSSIGVMWSNQSSRQDFFAVRSDATDPGTAKAGFGPPETAYGNGVGGCATTKRCADDHINLKVAGGEVYAAIKTSLGDGTSPVPTDPLIVLLRRSTTGAWSAAEVAPVSMGNVTQPIMLLAPQLNEIYVFASINGIKVWQSSFAAPAFDSTAWRRWAAGGNNYPTSTKQKITATSGAVVESTKKGTYWHNEFLPAQ
jgi:hypothetical protein